MSDKVLPETTSALLSQLCRLFRTQMHVLWDEIGLYRGQPFVLHILWEQEGVTHTDLASRMHVRPATVSNMITRMEKAGFVVRRPDAEDQRISRVYLTEAGRSIQNRVETVWRELDTTILAGFSMEERVLFRRLLLHVRDNMLDMHDTETK